MVLITGGSGGVGAQLARNFAKLNSRVIIWDINKEGKRSSILLKLHRNEIHIFANCRGTKKIKKSSLTFHFIIKLRCWLYVLTTHCTLYTLLIAHDKLKKIIIIITIGMVCVLTNNFVFYTLETNECFAQKHICFAHRRKKLRPVERAKFKINF